MHKNIQKFIYLFIKLKKENAFKAFQKNETLTDSRQTHICSINFQNSRVGLLDIFYIFNELHYINVIFIFIIEF